MITESHHTQCVEDSNTQCVYTTHVAETEGTDLDDVYLNRMNELKHRLPNLGRYMVRLGVLLWAERAEAVYKGEFTYAQGKPGGVIKSYDNSGIYMMISTLIIMAIGIVWLLLERRTYCSKLIAQCTRYSLRDACENERTHEELALEYYNFSLT